MTLDTWDREISPRLGRVERYSTYLQSDAATILRNARELASMPEFETKAGDELHRAKRELEAALEAVNLALGELSAKPVAA